MASKQQLIKEVAEKFGWTQADVKRAVDEYGEVKTKEDVIACCLHFAGPELKKRKFALEAAKKTNKKNLEIIENLTKQLTSVTNFYQSELVPTLRAKIEEQEETIRDILKQMPWAS